MPRAASTRAAPTTARRSSRLNNQQITKNHVVELPPRPKQRRRKPVTQQPPSLIDCVPESLEKPQLNALPRRSSRITPSELLRRESALEIREIECSRRVTELDARSLSLSKREDDVATLISQIAIRECKGILSQLEEHFTCALCYEVMAQPYSLNPGQCGHTFCALCILRHFFSRLHKACGGWHESVDCPMCRSLLVITPDRVPRLDITFPFVPNRTAAAVCESMIEKLSRSCPSSRSGLVVKREESPNNWPKSDWDLECQYGRKKGKSKEEEEMEEEDAELAGWREGGNLRTEWLKKDREGKKEMLNLLKYWTTMRSQDFVDLKHKFGV